MAFIFSTLSVANAQDAIMLGTKQEDIANSLTAYGGKYYIAGTSRKDEKSAKDYYILCLNADGTIASEALYGFQHHDVGSQVLVDSQGVFVIGSAYDFGFPNVDMHLFKLGKNGLPEWEKFYGTQYQDMGFDVIRTSDGGFAMIGYSNTQLDGGDFFFVKADSNGEMQWEKLFGPKYVDYGFSLLENKEGDYMLAGTENGFYNPTQTDFSTHDADILLIKTDNSGELKWYKTFGGNGHDWAKDIILAPEGGYFVCGSTQSYGSGSFDVFLMKVDESGNEEWMKTFGGPEFEYGESVQISEDNMLYMIGTSASYSGNLKPDQFLIKTNLDGDIIWTKTFGGLGSDYGTDLICTPDSGCMYTGWTDQGSHGRSDIVLCKVSKDGNPEVISAYSPFNDSLELIQVFPNPVQNKISVKITSKNEGNFKFSLFDINGKKVFEDNVTLNTINEFSPSVLPGIYFYTVINKGDNIFRGKLIFQ